MPKDKLVFFTPSKPDVHKAQSQHDATNNNDTFNSDKPTTAQSDNTLNNFAPSKLEPWTNLSALELLSMTVNESQHDAFLHYARELSKKESILLDCSLLQEPFNNTDGSNYLCVELIYRDNGNKKSVHRNKNAGAITMVDSRCHLQNFSGNESNNFQSSSGSARHPPLHS